MSTNAFTPESPERYYRQKPVTGVILAGGNSRRMGQNKALMRIGDETLIGHVIHRMRTVTDELLLITNSPEAYTEFDVPRHIDIIPNAGALGGIHTGLTYASYDAALCVACDTPFLEPKLLTYLVSLLDEYDAVVPYTCIQKKRTLQTLCAVYSKQGLRVIEKMLNESELRVHELYHRVRMRTVPPERWQPFDAEGLSFFNVNTPADFENAHRINNTLKDI